MRTLIINFCCVLLFLTEVVAETNSDGAAKHPDLRIGWQTTWATKGQLVQILQKTSILKDQSLNSEFVGFAYGAPLNQAALAGNVDVVLTADQPALTLISKDPNWEIIGRLMYNSGALMVRPNSPYKTISDLKGKTIAVPFVAAVHRVLIELETKAGLKPDEDIKNVNLGINEIQNLAVAGKESGWGTIDGMMVWDPTPFILEGKGLVRTIARGDITAVILMHKSKTANTAIPEKFLKAMREAYWYYRQHKGEANQWFATAANIDYDLEVLNKSAAPEPNLSANSREDIHLKLSAADIRNLKVVADFLFDKKLIDKQPDIDSAVKQSFINAVER